MPDRRTKAAPLPGKAAPLTLRKIADRLHKTVCQSVTGARFLISVIELQLPREAADLRKQLKEVDAALGDSCAELRALIKELRGGSEQ